MSVQEELLEKIAICVERSGEKLVLCGGLAAYLICKAANAQAEIVLTEDADLLIERRQKAERDFATSPVTVAKSLEEAGFTREIATIPIAETGGLPSEHWKSKEFSEMYVEFLTEDHNKERHSISGITAQGLSYFSMSLEHTFKYTLPSGREIDVVAPDAFVMHKALTFPKRGFEQKKHKDLYYIAFVGKNAFPSIDQLRQDLERLDIVSAWRNTATKNLAMAGRNLGKWMTPILLNDVSGQLLEKDVKEVCAAGLITMPDTSNTKTASLGQKSISRTCKKCGRFCRLDHKTPPLQYAKYFCIKCFSDSP